VDFLARAPGNVDKGQSSPTVAGGATARHTSLPDPAINRARRRRCLTRLPRNLHWMTHSTEHEPSLAPLPFARDAVIVPVHFRAGTVPQKVRRFGTGSHLRTVRTAVALECGGASALQVRRSLRRQARPLRFRLAHRLCRKTVVVLAVAVPTHCGDDQQNDETFHVFRYSEEKPFAGNSSWLSGQGKGLAAISTVNDWKPDSRQPQEWPPNSAWRTPVGPWRRFPSADDHACCLRERRSYRGSWQRITSASRRQSR